ncbi:hypothetical protein C8Q80DRAFT_822418 [Daedaleopsis nitida]|nr:hypothetical protein C8Q80DRAFT_822418 [Daedaleopsis nitida]
MDVCGDGSCSAFLAACALVSSDWLPCARLNLYRNIQLARYDNVILLLRTLKDNAALARHTQILIISPTSVDSSYLPFALLSPYLPNLRTLIIGAHTAWDRYPPIYHTIGTHFEQITHLTLSNDYRSLLDMLRLIWSFRNLERFYLIWDAPSIWDKVQIAAQSDNIGPTPPNHSCVGALLVVGRLWTTDASWTHLGGRSPYIRLFPGISIFSYEHRGPTSRT